MSYAPLDNDEGGIIRVLHVDDEPDFADMVATFLEREDDQLLVETAMSASEGLDQFADAEFDCIVSDYDMPDQNGLEFLETVRTSNPDIPFILFTGKGSEEIAADAISAGVTDYLQKESGSEQYTVLANRIRNVVKQYRSRQLIEQTHTWYQTVLEHSSDYVLIVDESGIVQAVTPPVKRVLGYPPEELVGTSSFETIHEDDLEVAIEAFGELASNPNQEQTVKFRAEHADGSYRWLEVRGRKPLNDSIIDGVLVNVRDITEQQDQQQDINRYEAFLENSPDLFFVLDETGTVTYQAHASEEILEYELPDLQGESIGHLIHPDDRQSVEGDFEYLLENPNEPVVSEYRFQLPNGEWGWFENRAINKLRNPAIDGVLVINRNITSRKEREQRLDEFASIVSHDLRNPLNVAVGRLELVDEECESEHIEVIDRSLTRMDNLIENLLTVAREGERVSEPEIIELADLFEDCWQHVETVDATMHIRIDRQIRADRSYLEQLFENLIRNAVEHGGEDVTVTIGELENGFYIEDDGPGIPERDRDDVFELGYSTSEGNTGFGLNIVNRVVNAQGWDVTVTDGATGGARFEITGVDCIG